MRAAGKTLLLGFRRIGRRGFLLLRPFHFLLLPLTLLVERFRVVLKPDATRGCDRGHILQVFRPEAICQVSTSVGIELDATDAHLVIVLPGLLTEVLPDSSADLPGFGLMGRLTL